MPTNAFVKKAIGGRCAAGYSPALKNGNRPIDNKTSLLTAAEHRVLALVARAKTNKEIARELGISPATVKRHLENLLRKLQLKNRVEAAIHGLLIDGCTRGVNAGCALQRWHDERAQSRSTWAE